MVHVRLAEELPDRKIKPIKVVLATNQKDEQQTFSHPGEEF
ncbi:hypothetical protein [Halobacillus ihumii]|nr:hypothetical protein [Halobacillus ihumii]